MVQTEKRVFLPGTQFIKINIRKFAGLCFGDNLITLSGYPCSGMESFSVTSESHCLTQSFSELFKVFFVQKNFVLLVEHLSLFPLPLLALRYCQIKIFVSCGLHIKEVSPLTCTYHFGENLLFIISLILTFSSAFLVFHQ